MYHHSDSVQVLLAGQEIQANYEQGIAKQISLPCHAPANFLEILMRVMNSDEVILKLIGWYIDHPIILETFYKREPL